MKNKGFTLVELLAVIAILAILIIIALPNIMDMFNQAKKNSFLIEVKEIYNTAKSKWINDSLGESKERIYARSNSEVCLNQLVLTGRKEIEYYIKISKSGNVIEYYATDGTYGFKYVGLNLEESEIKDAFRMDELSEDDYFEIKCNGILITANTIPDGADLLMPQYNPLSENETFLRTRILKSKIEKITITNSLEGHTKNNTNCFDAGSYGKGKILSWVEDKDSNGLYEITIGSEEKIFPNSCLGLFAQLTNLKELKGLENINTYNCPTMAYMFYQDKNLTSLDVSHFKTKNVEQMNYMFHGLQKITSLDLSHFDTSKAINMSNMFNDCGSLKTLDVSSFNTSKVTNMSNMFSRLQTIKTLDLSNFDTSNVVDMKYMFYYDTSLKSINVSSFNTSNVTHMQFMFYNTRLETLDVSNFDTSKVRNMECMFDSLYNIKILDLSNFDTSNVVNFDNMFQACNKLEKIYVGDKFILNSNSTSRRMFWGCKKLKGGSGTAWNENNITGTYAHIDGGVSNPGYFTSK